MFLRPVFLGCWLTGLFLLHAAAAHAQTPGVDCVPVQGQGWSGCAPTGGYQRQQPAYTETTYAWFAMPAGSYRLFWSFHYPDRNSAEAAALASCEKATGKKCDGAGGFYNQFGVLAFVPKTGGTVYLGVGNSPKKAARDAFHDCYKANSAPGTVCHLLSLPVCGYPSCNQADSDRAAAATADDIAKLEEEAGNHPGPG